MKLKFYFDEDVPVPLAEALRRRGISKLYFTLSSEEMKNRLEFLSSWK